MEGGKGRERVKEKQLGAWKDGSVVKSACSCRGPRFNSQNSCGDSQSFITLVPERSCYRYACEQNTHRHKIFKNVKKNEDKKIIFPEKQPTIGQAFVDTLYTLLQLLSTITWTERTPIPRSGD